MAVTKAQKWGKGVAVPIPASTAKRLGIEPGTPLEVSEENGRILVKVARRKRTLSEIMRECRRRFPNGNPHGELDIGPPVGREIW